MVEEPTADPTAATDSTTATTTTTPNPLVDNVSPLPAWVIGWLLGLVGLIIVAMFVVTVYNLSAPRSTLKNLLGIKGIWRRKFVDENERSRGRDVSPKLVSALALSTQVNTRTTRTTLAISGFALLGLGAVGVLALGGTGVRDLRTQLFSGIVTLVATIAGFYFGQANRAANNADPAAAPAGPAPAAPRIAHDPDDQHRTFVIGTTTTYSPLVTGTPTPTLALIGDLPDGLSFDRATGTITGSAKGPAGVQQVQVVATNGTPPDVSLPVELTVQP